MSDGEKIKMNKSNVFVCGAVVILVSVVLFHSGCIKVENPFNEFLLEGADENLEMTARVDLILGLENGEKKTITGYDGSPLAVRYDGDPVSQVEWRLMVKATTPGDDEPYYNAQVTIAPTFEDEYVGPATKNFKLHASCYRINNIWSDTFTPSMTYSFNTVSVTPGGGYELLWSETIPMSDVFVGDLETGGYSFKFEVSGQGAYRGYSLQQGHGDWQTVSFSDYDMDATYSLQYTGYDVEVDFDENVIWS